MRQDKERDLSLNEQANVVIWGEYAGATGIRCILEQLDPNETIVYVTDPYEIKDKIGCRTRLVIGVGQSLLHGLHAMLDVAIKYPGITQLLISAMQGHLLNLLMPGVKVLAIKSSLNEINVALKKLTACRHTPLINEGFLRLTTRQKDVLYLLVYGKSVAAIGRYLGMSEKVVSSTKMMIMKKMNIEHRGEMHVLCSMLSKLPQQQWRKLVKYHATPLSMHNVQIKHLKNNSLYSEMSA